MAAVAALSAVFSNDVVCLAIAPVLADACARRRLDPVPYLIGLACAANIGSAATLIGNPQNMLIGQVLGMHFAAYLREAFLPALLGLAAAWGSLPGVFLLLQELSLKQPRGVKANTRARSMQTARDSRSPARCCWCFCSPTGRARSPRSRSGHPDDEPEAAFAQDARPGRLELLILFIGLFVVNHAFERTGLAAQAIRGLAAAGLPLSEPAPLFATTFVLSNVVSNVPAVMLLLRRPPSRFGPDAGARQHPGGNLVIVGSVANIIVVDAARRRGIAIDWRRHAMTGIQSRL